MILKLNTCILILIIDWGIHMIDKKLKTKIFISSIIIFLMGALFHFAYQFLGNNFIVGLITPINESIGEHLKLAIFPIFIWWLIYYLVEKKNYSLDKGKWFLGCSVSMIVSIFIILGISYFVRYGLDKESIIIDIMSLYIALVFGQFTGYHIYNFSKLKKNYFSVTMISIIIISFIILTITPPKLPLFEDAKNHTYGINKEIKR